MNDAPVALPDAQWLETLRAKLRAWYAGHARDLPWRRSRDPYAVWLSEVMLQQTQVATVEPYFERFTAALPTIHALAEAQEQQVLRLWEGLGYYRRARQLHEAARRIVREHAGRFPRDPDVLRSLPGIGRYTAGAVLSIAFDQPEPILEANTARLFCRLLAYRGSVSSAAGQELLWAMARAVLPRRGAGRLNQALMELGSEVCRARRPQCDVCPVPMLCRARAAGIEGQLPQPKPRPLIEEVHEAAALVRRGRKVLLIQWPEGRRWAGLWDFPRSAVHGRRPDEVRRELAGAVRELAGVVIRPGELLKTLRHGVTRFRITLDCYEAEYVGPADDCSASVPARWLRPAELDAHPLSSTGRKLARLA
jgi:A/G-specific adenine glycosylase